MYIQLENTKYQIEEFLKNDNLIQGNVSFPNKFYNDFKETYFLHKLKEQGGAYSIFLMKCYGKDELYFDDANYNFLLSFDNKNKIIICDETYCINLKKELKEIFTEYQIWEKNNLSIHIQKEYKNKLRKKFDENTELFKNKFKDYKERYCKILHEYKTNIEDDYLNNICDYDLYVKELENNSSIDLVNLQNYLKNPKRIDDLVEEVFAENTKKYSYNSMLYDHAEIQAKKELLKQIKTNPSNNVKCFSHIKNKINGIGKTLNIVTKDNKKIKVKNLLLSDSYNGGYFNTVTGYTKVKITDISKIIFRKNIIFDYDNFSQDI